MNRRKMFLGFDNIENLVFVIECRFYDEVYFSNNCVIITMWLFLNFLLWECRFCQQISQFTFKNMRNNRKCLEMNLI